MAGKQEYVSPVVEVRNTPKTGLTVGDYSRLVGNENAELVLAGYDWVTNTLQVAEANPLSLHYVSGTLANVTNGTDGTYEYFIDMDGYNKLGLQLVLDGGSGTVTVTVEATMQSDGTPPASCTYEDVTSSVYGPSSFTSNAMLFDTNGFFGQVKYVKVKVVASTGGADDADWTIYYKKLY